MRRLRERARAASPLAVAIVLIAGLAPAGCGRPPERRQIEVGEHRLSLEPPPGWRHLDHGRKQLYRRDDAQIALVEIGPVGRTGIRREVERALALGLEGRGKDAAARLGRVRVPDDLFDSLEQRNEFREAWSTAAATADAPADTASVHAAFDRLLAEVDRLPELDLEASLPQALRDLGEDRRRDVAETRSVRLGGRDALAVDTWYRLTHQDRRHYVLVFDDGCLLALRADRGGPAGTTRALEAVMRSLEFAGAAADSAAGATSGAAVSGR